MNSVFSANERKLALFTIMLATVVVLVLAELVLRIFWPHYFATIGHVYSRNAVTYGWGYNPHELISITDPDTGEVYISRGNNHGWRDKDRSYTNDRNAYRILVLGDSGTFGAVVPSEKVYTRILEDKLIADGFNVEVINISYGKWGTDQQ